LYKQSKIYNIEKFDHEPTRTSTNRESGEVYYKYELKRKRGDQGLLSEGRWACRSDFHEQGGIGDFTDVVGYFKRPFNLSSLSWYRKLLYYGI